MTVNHFTSRTLSYLLLLALTCSCGSYLSGSRREDLLNRCFSKTELKATNNWKMGDDQLILKRNNTFRYCTSVMGITSEYYTGTYERQGDTIAFSFTKNNRFYILAQKDTLSVGYVRNTKPAFFAKTDTLILTQKTNYDGTRNDILWNKNGDYMTIVQNSPRNKK
jgi:hypothetical protein